MADVTEYTRLHITPFDAALLPSYVQPSLLPKARNISYHTIETSSTPFGYLDLPMEDATKLKRKLHGSILKGQKIKISDAKPRYEHIPEAPEVEKPKRKTTKRKRDEIPGAEIGERSVKRGWTVPDLKKKRGDKEKKVKSKYTTEKECLFKTVLPPNKSDREKKGKRTSKGKEIVVHEFEKSTKYATFLREAAGKKGKGVAEFVEGKGWLDEDGNLVEQEVVTQKGKGKGKNIETSKALHSDQSSDSSSENSSEESALDEEIEMKTKPAVQIGPEHSSSKSSDNEDMGRNLDSELRSGSNEPTSSSDDSSSDEEEDNTQGSKSALPVIHADSESSNSSSSDSSSEEDSDSSSSGSDDMSGSPSALSDAPSTPAARVTRPTSSSGLTLTIPNSATSLTPISSTVHPLEALYKRPKVGSNDEDTPKPTVPSFSFFGTDGDDEEMTEARDTVPLTPFTQKDFEYRGLRSAAPTPDTAHGNKRFIWPTESDDEANSPTVPKETESSKKPENEKTGEAESDFTKWFYEHRGDATRAWKKRRKTVAKEKRQRENRKRADR